MGSKVIRAYGERVRVPFECVGESMTKQSFKNECDINVIMRRYQKTGLVPVNAKPGVFMDVTSPDLTDYRMQVERVHRVSEIFAALPSSIRFEFENDVGLFLDHVVRADEDELRRIGLMPVVEDVVADVEPAAPVVEDGPKPA